MTEHAYIKLEFPDFKNSIQKIQMNSRNEMEDEIELMLRGFRSALLSNDIHIVSRQPIEIVEEEDCNGYFEVNYEVASNEFSHTIIEAMKEYYIEFNKKIGSPYQFPTAVLHGDEFWSTRLESHVSDVPLSAIYFGNIQEGTFLNHWEISFWKKTQSLLKKRAEGKHDTREGPMEKITADFEFDRRNMLTVQFQCLEMRKRKELMANYQVIIQRDIVRRIIVDPLVYDEYGGPRTRIHFEVNCPPLIRRADNDQDIKSNANLPFYHRRRCFDCNWGDHGFPEPNAISDSPFVSIEFRGDVSTEEIYHLLARLNARTRVSIEFGLHPVENIPIGRRQPYNRWTFSRDFAQKEPTDKDAPIYREFLEYLFPEKMEIVDKKLTNVNEERSFAITYLIECLLSRGAVVKDQLLLHEDLWENFLKIIITYYEEDDKLCEAALEDLIHLIDGRKKIGNISKCLEKICQKRKRMKLVNGLSENEMKQGYQRVRKVVLTPTRVIYVAPETIMGNRVLRRYDHDGTKMLRVVFRDDNNKKMRRSTTEHLLDITVNKYLKNGVRVANRDFGFLGCSNSQMRDNGAYFMVKYSEKRKNRYISEHPGNCIDTYQPNIDAVRRDLGNFDDVGSVPKMIARMGQCFTQSSLTGVELKRSDYVNTYDLTGGKSNNLQKTPYIFSDGVGMMSFKFAKAVSEAKNFGRAVPSCLQIRFRGMKGVISIEPYLDDVLEWANKYISEDIPHSNTKCAFRKSQTKFAAKARAADQIELVKYSSPVLVALNKPLINILDQVSEMQSMQCHRRVINRIEELMDLQILSFTKQMNEETHCRNKLKEFPHRIDIDYLKTMWGFTLSSEPYFRSLIKASIKFSIMKQLRKEQIQIPSTLGRSMFGVVDESGRLQYGQVFVQFTENYLKKFPVRLDDKSVQGTKIVTGTVLLTKNPCIVSGDVRIFTAVDIPELHHLCDVVVFPQHGPRPHPDEMAGSDLDGDEYSVIWDQQLLLDRNEEPFDFSVEKKEQEYDKTIIDKLMREFYVKYLKLDSVGMISNGHLHNADQYGLNSRVCMDLAKKNCQAVDFTKSGDPPEPLTTKWHKENNEMIPPEASERIPDFHTENEVLPMYISSRLCGVLYREFESIHDIIKISEERAQLFEISIDPFIHVPGYETYLNSARQDLANYNGQLRSIMNTYGITTEGEIMSGCIIEMRNRISDKDQDDMSFYNSNKMIETRITSLVSYFREHFFEEFGGYRMVCSQLPNAYYSDSCFNFRCDLPNMKIMQKAVAWYRACYEAAQTTRDVRKLSFAWLAYDVIAKVKERHVLNAEFPKMGLENPMYTFLENHRKQYLIDNNEAFQNFKTLNMLLDGEKSKEAISILKMYLAMVPGLDIVLFILMRWAEEMKCFDDQPIRIYQFFLIFILFATRQLCSIDSQAVPFFKKIDKEEFERMAEKDTENSETGVPLTEEKISYMIVKFLEYMASRTFRMLSILSFSPLGFSSIFMRGEWKIFHEAALKTYYNILFNLRFEELPVSTDTTVTSQTMIRESEPFVIELPDSIDFRSVLSHMTLHSKAVDVYMRRIKMSKAKDTDEGRSATSRVRYIVTARGTLESIMRLKKLARVMIPVKCHLEGEEVSKQIASLCYHQIINGNV